MRRLVPPAMLAVALLAACNGTNRPEGVVEQWLISLNQGKAGQPQTYAPANLSNEVLPNWRRCDPGSLDVIEVGVHGYAAVLHPPGTVYVPYRVKYVSDLSSCDSSRRPSAPRVGTAALAKGPDGWRIASLQPRSPSSTLRVPSEGGARIGSASAATWGVAVAISVGLMLLVALVMALTPKPVTLPTRRRE